MIKALISKRLGLFYIGCLMLFSAVAFTTKPAQAGIEEVPFYEECEDLDSLASENNSDKWWEKPFTIVSEAAVEFGEGTYDAVASDAVKLLAVGLALWIVLYYMKVLGGLTEADPMDNLTKVFGMLFKGLFAAIILRNSGLLFGYFVAPIMQIGAGMAGIDGGGSATGAGGLFESVSALKGVLDDAHSAAARTQAIGELAMCISKIYTVTVFGLELFSIIDPGVWSHGCALTFATWILGVCWPILVFDALFRLGITAALCPLFVVAWVFPSTSSYTGKGFKSFLNVAFFYVCLNFAVKMGLKLLEGSSGLDVLRPGTDAAKTAAVCALRIGKGENCPEVASKPGFQSLVIFGACVFYCILFLKEATTFANFFSDAQFSNDTAFQATKSAAGAAQKTAMVGADVAGAAYDKHQEHKDRSAARDVNRVRSGEDNLQRGVFGGNGSVSRAFNNSKVGQAINNSWAGRHISNWRTRKAENNYLKSEERLRDRGFINSDGSENKAYGDLLKNNFGRKVLNAATLGTTNKNEYNKYAAQGGPRGKDNSSVVQANDRFNNYMDKKYGGEGLSGVGQRLSTRFNDVTGLNSNISTGRTNSGNAPLDASEKKARAGLENEFGEIDLSKVEMVYKNKSGGVEGFGYTDKNGEAQVYTLRESDKSQLSGYDGHRISYSGNIRDDQIENSVNKARADRLKAESKK